MSMQNPFGANSLDDMAKARGDLGNGGIPGYRLKTPLSLGADAPERLRQALALIEHYPVVKYLAFATQLAATEEMFLVAAHGYDPAIFTQHFNAAGIVAIARTGSFKNFFVQGHIASPKLEVINLTL